MNFENPYEYLKWMNSQLAIKNKVDLDTFFCESKRYLW